MNKPKKRQRKHKPREWSGYYAVLLIGGNPHYSLHTTEASAQFSASCRSGAQVVRVRLVEDMQ